MASKIPAIRKNADIAIRAQWLLDSTVQERMDVGLNAEDVIADLLAEIRRIRPYMADLVRQWIEDHPAEALSVLEAKGVLAKRWMRPVTPHVDPTRRTWVLHEAPPGGPPDATEVWVRTDTLPPLTGEEGAGDGE